MSALAPSAAYPESGSPDLLILATRRQTIFLSTHDMVTEPTDIPASTPIHGRLRPFRWRSEMGIDQAGRFAGAAPLGLGDIELENIDRQLDSIFGSGITDGGRVTVYLEQMRVDSYGRNKAPALASFGIAVTAAAEQWTAGDTSINVPLRDATFRLDRPAQPYLYSGSGDLGGPTSLGGTTKPIGYGVVRGARPTLLDQANQIYQFNDISSKFLDMVYDSVVKLERAENYDTFEDLQAASPAPGTFISCLAKSCLRLGSDPAGVVTCDFHGGDRVDRVGFFTDGSKFTDSAGFASRVAGQYVEDTSSIIARLITDRAIGQFEDIETTSFAQSALAQPAPIGFFIPGGSNDTLLQVINLLAAAAGMVFGQSSDGRYSLRRFEAPNTSWITLTDREIFDLRRINLPYRIPPATWYVAGNRNWTPMTATDIADGAENSDIQFALRDVGYGIANDLGISAVTSGTVGIVPGFFDSLADATLEARRLIALYSLGRGLYEVLVPIFAMRYYLGMPLTIKYPMTPFTVGLTVVITGIDIDLSTEQVKLMVFG